MRFRRRRSLCKRQVNQDNKEVHEQCLALGFNLISFLQLIDDLRRELEYLQLFKLEMEHPGKGKGLSEFNAKARESEMEHEVRRLKQVHTHSNLFFCSFKAFTSLHLIPCELCVCVFFFYKNACEHFHRNQTPDH